MQDFRVQWTSRDLRERLSDNRCRTYRQFSVIIPQSKLKTIELDESVRFLHHFFGRINQKPVMFSNHSALSSTLLLLGAEVCLHRCVLNFAWRKDRGKRPCEFTGDLTIGHLGWNYFYSDAAGCHRKVTEADLAKVENPSRNYLQYAEDLRCERSSRFDAIPAWFSAP